MEAQQTASPDLENNKTEERRQLEEQERLREETRRQKEEEERKRYEQETIKLELEREEARKRREQSSPKFSRAPIGCYKTNTINVDKPIQINLSDIKPIHVMTAQGYLREIITNIKLQDSVYNDIINEITYFYAKPLALKIKLNPMLLSSSQRKQQKQTVIKCILFCPIDDDWGNLLSNIRNAFNLSMYARLTGLNYTDDNGQTTHVSYKMWDENKFDTYNADNIFEMTDVRKKELERDEARKRREQRSPKFSRVPIGCYKTREQDVIVNKKRRQKREEKTSQTKELGYIKKNFLEMISSSEETESESDYSDSSYSSDNIVPLKDKLKRFDKIAATGQLFIIYNGVMDNETEEVIVKINFENNYKPTKIIWGSGDKYIKYEDVLYIAWGHWTPIFDEKYRNNTNEMNARICFSVVANDMILDIKGQSEQIVELWVKGLRKLIGQTDYMSDKLSKQGLEEHRLRNVEMKEEEKGLDNVTEDNEINMMNVYENKKDNINGNMLIIGGIVVIGIVLIVVLNRKLFFK